MSQPLDLEPMKLQLGRCLRLTVSDARALVAEVERQRELIEQLYAEMKAAKDRMWENAHEVEALRAAAASAPPATEPQWPRYQCHECGNNFTDKPFCGSVNGFNDRVFYFCSSECRAKWAAQPLRQGEDLRASSPGAREGQLDGIKKLVASWRDSARFLNELSTQNDITKHDAMRFNRCAEELEHELARSAAPGAPSAAPERTSISAGEAMLKAVGGAIRDALVAADAALTPEGRAKITAFDRILAIVERGGSEAEIRSEVDLVKAAPLAPEDGSHKE